MKNLFTVTLVLITLVFQGESVANEMFQPWLDHAEVRITYCQNQSGPAPVGLRPGGIGGRERNIDIGVSCLGVVADSIQWTYIVGEDTLHFRRNEPEYMRLFPTIVIRAKFGEGDTAEYSYSFPGWTEDWGVKWTPAYYPDRIEWKVSIDPPREDWFYYEDANLKGFVYKENTTVSMALIEGVPLRIYYIYRPLTFSITNPDTNFIWHKYNFDEVAFGFTSDPDWKDPEQFFTNLEEDGWGVDWVDDTIPVPDYEPEEQIRFVGYILPDSTGGNDWLPIPGDSVGVIVECVDSTVTSKFGYHIYDISTWQGECMNSPISPPIPVATGTTDEYFDMIVCDTMKYYIYPFSYDWPVRYDYSDVDLERKYHAIIDENYPFYSQRGYDIIKKVESRRDTLWITATDYAGHCVIAPRRLAGKGQTRMNMTTDAWGDSIWTISVPRDNDGYYVYGSNTGDYMADAWESANIPSSMTIQEFVGFADLAQPNEAADFDNWPIGRIMSGHQILGDNLSNFEEYRGFLIKGDKSGFFASQHKRTNPFNRSVLAHLTPILGDSLLSLFPHYISKVDTLEVFFTDSLVLSDLRDPNIRRNVEKWITPNQLGASRIYYCFPLITKEPFYIKQNAVTFWPYDNIQELFVKSEPDTDLVGITYAWRNLSVYDPSATDSLAFTPKAIQQVVLLRNHLNLNIGQQIYYEGQPDTIKTDRDWYTRVTIGHEFGHTIGMDHLHATDVGRDTTIMSCYLFFSSVPLDSGRLIKYVPSFDAKSRSEITTNRPK